jgi:hypothetical protein
MPTTRGVFLAILGCLAVLASSASASISVTDGGTSFFGSPQTMTLNNIEDDSAVATIQCDVFSGTAAYADKFVYTYQIANTSAANLSHFSVQIYEGTGIEALGLETAAGDIEPIFWDAVGGDPAQSFQAQFTTSIGNGEQSSLMWFVSEYAPGLGEGVILGMDDGFVIADGVLVTPVQVPEPATLLLLSSGVFAMIRKRK